MKRIYKSLIITSLIILGACESNFENDVKQIEITSGEANFSKYVALGNSLTSGYTDGALYKMGQENSFPAILAKQMRLVGGGEFTQPLMPDNIGGFSDLFALKKGELYYGKLKLKNLNGRLLPTPTTPQKTLAESFVRGSFNNMGVPGAKSYHLLADGYGNPAGMALGKANPYFVRFASSPNTSVLKDAMAQSPTFFTLWIGNNDVLGYAMSGASATDQQGNLDAGSYGLNDLSDPNIIVGSIQKILENLVKVNKAKGAIANLPNVQDVPFFNTIPSKPLNPKKNLTYANQIETLNTVYGSLNKIYDALDVPERKIYFNPEENSGAVIKDESLPNIAPQIKQALLNAGKTELEATLYAQLFGQTRQSKEGDLFPLPLMLSLGQVNEEFKQQLIAKGIPEKYATMASYVGVSYPIPDEDVLTPDEINVIKNRTLEVNKKIELLAGKYNLAYVDLNKKMNELKSGIKYNGVNFDASFIKGGVFSLDGIHLNAKGYAIIANYFIEAINKKYNATLSFVDVNSYHGTELP